MTVESVATNQQTTDLSFCMERMESRLSEIAGLAIDPYFQRMWLAGQALANLNYVQGYSAKQTADLAIHIADAILSQLKERSTTDNG